MPTGTVAQDAQSASLPAMCNLYRLDKGQDHLRQFFKVARDETGNMPPLPGIFPDYMAPIVRTGTDGERELVMARWGMPTPPKFQKEGGDRPRRDEH
jgi:putative SOS response-associated peptidase YedK